MQQHAHRLITSCVLAMATGAAAQPLAITEVWPGGLPGEEATADWIEVTNLGDAPFTAFDQLLLRNNAVPTTFPDGVPLSGGTFQGVAELAPGASAVFMTDYTADAYDPVTQTFYNAATPQEAIAAFRAVWGSPVNDTTIGFIEATFGGPGDGLDREGEDVFLLRGETFATGSVTLLDHVSYPQSDRASWEFTDPASEFGTLSAIGVNSAFEAALPANAQPGPLEGVPPVGSPGVFVPEPVAAVALLPAFLLARRPRAAQ